MVPWWEQWPGRLEAELQAFQDRGLAFRLDDAEFAAGRVVLRGSLTTPADGLVNLVVAYPDTYPHMRFTAYAPDLALDRHQHPFGRNLCLLPRGSDYWRPSQLAAPLVADAVPQLLAVLRGGADAMRAAEDPQGEPFSDYYRYWARGGVLVPASALSLPRETARGGMTIRLRGDARWLDALLKDSHPAAFGQALLSRVDGDHATEIAVAEPSLAALFAGRELTGRWLRLGEPLRAADGPGFAEKVFSIDPSLRASTTPFRTDAGHFDLVGVVFPEEVEQGVFQDAWTFLLLARSSRRDQHERGVLLRGLRATEEDLAARIPELRPLRSRTASIVGLGSLGAPIAHELARAMIGRLRLFDPDHVDAGTGARWLLGMEAAGLPKVQQLEALFRRNYPFSEVEPMGCYIGVAPLKRPLEPDAEARLLDRWLDGAHIVIDATAEDNVSRLVAALAHRNAVPQVFVWSVEGYGGVVARIIPGRTGCYHCLSMAMDPDAGHIASPAPPAGRARVQPRGCADPTFAAAAPDLEPLSLHAARVAFGILCAGAPGAYPSFRHDVFVLTHRAPDGSLVSPPRWDAYELPVNPACPRCNPPAAT